MDCAWRMKVGFVAASALGAFFCVWPTLESMSDGKIHCPRTSATTSLRHRERPRPPGRPPPRLHGRGRRGDPRQARPFADEMRQELAIAVQLPHGRQAADARRAREARGEGPRSTSRRESRSSRSSSRTRPTSPRSTSVPEEVPGRARRADAGRAGRGHLQDPRRGRDADPRARGHPGQGHRHPPRRRARPPRGERHHARRGHHRRGAGRGRAAFDEIKEIIRKTARLEFKMVDDETDFFGRSRETSKTTISPKARASPNNGENAPGRPRQDRARRTSRASSKQPNETMHEARERLKKWIGDAQRPRRPPGRLREVRRLRSRHGKHDRDRAGARSTSSAAPRSPATTSPTRSARPISRARGLGGATSRITFSPAGARSLRGDHRRERQAPLRDHPRRRHRLRAGHQDEDRRRPRAASRWARATPSSSSKTRASSSWCSAPARSRRRSRRRTSRSSARRSARTRSRRACKGAVAGIAPRARLHGALLPAAPASSPTSRCSSTCSSSSRSSRRSAHDDACPASPASRSPSAWPSTPTCSSTSASARSCAHGKSLRAAVEAGYDKAFSAILDGHVTVVHLRPHPRAVRHGPVKGFAVTLIIGIIASLFTGVFCTRLVFDWWVRGAKVKTLSVG